MFPTHLLCGALLLFTCQSPSLRDTARRNGGTAVLTIDVNAPIGELSYVIAESTVILRGVVRSVTVRLSDDEAMVVTDYEIAPTEFYKGSFTAFTSKPGVAAPLVVRQPGGTLELDNLHLRTVINEFPEDEFLLRGEEVFLFLAPEDNGRFRLHRGPFGAFRVINGNVTAMTKSAAAQRHDGPKTISEFERELRQRLLK